MMQLTMKSWRKGLLTVSLIELVKKLSTGSLIRAKADVERLLDGFAVTLEFESKDAMDEFKIKAIEFGVLFD